ncbi:MAG: hypothetical protein MUF30_12445 [Burkholderiales bacterium]|nr:hypothetical protein [Burkholderiales bacterium]
MIGELGAFLLLGFVLGMRHATDADHVVAITTIVGRARSLAPAAWIGVLWGAGHTLTVLAVGGAIVVFQIAIPARVGLAMEFAVGVMLVVLGVLALRGWWRDRRPRLAGPWIAVEPGPGVSAAHALARPGHTRVGRAGVAGAHDHMHLHGDWVHAHTHDHGGHGHAEHAVPTAWLDRRFGTLRGWSALRPVAVGLVHGMAGSAAVALLALGAIHDPWWGMAYLMLFGFGTVRAAVRVECRPRAATARRAAADRGAGQPAVRAVADGRDQPRRRPVRPESAVASPLSTGRGSCQ